MSRVDTCMVLSKLRTSTPVFMFRSKLVSRGCVVSLMNREAILAPCGRMGVTRLPVMSATRVAGKLMKLV